MKYKFVIDCEYSRHLFNIGEEVEVKKVWYSEIRDVLIAECEYRGFDIEIPVKMLKFCAREVD